MKRLFLHNVFRVVSRGPDIPKQAAKNYLKILCKAKEVLAMFYVKLILE